MLIYFEIIIRWRTIHPWYSQIQGLWFCQFLCNPKVKDTQICILTAAIPGWWAGVHHTAGKRPWAHSPDSAQLCCCFLVLLTVTSRSEVFKNFISWEKQVSLWFILFTERTSRTTQYILGAECHGPV